MVGEGAHVEVVHGQPVRRDPELGGRLADLAGERVGRKALRQGARRDREGDVADVGSGCDEAGHRPSAPELAVIGVRREHERAPDVADQAGSSGTAPSARAATTISARSAQNVGSSKSAL